jgi:hypothetical protein
VSELSLVEFLTARLNDDEAAELGGIAAASATAEEAGDWLWVKRSRAEREAKRRIVDLHPPTDPYNREGDRYCRRCLSPGYDTGYPDEWCQDDWPCPTLRLLALPFADHPDYREEWKP